MIELVGIYVILMYSDNLEVYAPMFLVGFSFIMIMLGDEGTMGKMVLMRLWPRYVVYISWISGLLQGIKLMESVKKLVALVVVSFMLISFNSVLLLMILRFSARGVLGVVTLGIYISFSIVSGMILLLFLYVGLGIVININYKVLVIGVLPLPVFFIKTFGFWGIYIVILMGIIVFLE